MRVFICPTNHSRYTFKLGDYLSYIHYDTPITYIFMHTGHPYSGVDVWAKNNDVKVCAMTPHLSTYGPVKAPEVLNSYILNNKEIDKVLYIDESHAASDMMQKALIKGIKVTKYGKLSRGSI